MNSGAGRFGIAFHGNFNFISITWRLGSLNNTVLHFGTFVASMQE